MLAAEVWGIIYGLRLSWELGSRTLIPEVDNKCAVDILSGRNQCPRQCLALFTEAKCLIQRNWTVQVTHSYREMNCCADYLANKGIKGTIGYVSWNVPPLGIKELLRRDSMGVAIPRMCLQ